MSFDVTSYRKLKDIPVGREGWVYLIHGEGTTRYKIGRSVNPVARHQILQKQSPYPLKIVDSFWTLDAIADEAHFHELHREKRVHGEWFDFNRSIKWLLHLMDNPVWESNTKWLLYESNIDFLGKAFTQNGFHGQGGFGGELLSLYDYAKSRADFEIIEKVVYSAIPEKLQSRCIDNPSLNTYAYISGILDATQSHLTGYAEESEE